jgi:hypothetical protein
VDTIKIFLRTRENDVRAHEVPVAAARSKRYGMIYLRETMARERVSEWDGENDGRKNYIIIIRYRYDFVLRVRRSPREQRFRREVAAIVRTRPRRIVIVFVYVFGFFYLASPEKDIFQRSERANSILWRIAPRYYALCTCARVRARVCVTYTMCAKPVLVVEK